MESKTTHKGLLHGGDLLTASKKTGISVDQWLDLSTGISPYAYPSHSIPEAVFSKLPYIDQAFNEHAKQYYGSDQFVALPGTQAAIQLMPSFLETFPVLLPSVGYQEHQQAWKKSGNQLDYYDALDEQNAFEEIELKLTKQPKQHLLIINPNNPSSLIFTPQQLILWSKKLAKDAYLIVDEAFIDCLPSQSLVPVLSELSTFNNIIVLRSFGKFFGLAGIRLGFVFAADALLRKFEEHIPLWSINGPALYLASKAFSDRAWQSEHHKKLFESECFTRDLFEHLPYQACFHQRLFSSYVFPKTLALTIFNEFYCKGVLLRLIDLSKDKSILRVGRVQVEDKSVKNRLSAILTSFIIEA